MDLKYSANVLVGKRLGVRVCVFAASFRSFQYSFAFLYLASIRRLVFAFFKLRFELSYCHFKISSCFDHINSVSIDTVLSIFIQYV